MEIFHIVLIIATFLCSLVAGFLFAFAIVAMPGINKLNDGAFIRAFQVMDGVIQNNQPIFMLVWAGSVVALVIAGVMGIGRLDGTAGLLLLVAVVVYLVGVQLPTATINVPLNNQLQTLNVDSMDESSHRAARQNFEPRWNRWNAIRTVLACLVAALLMILLFLL